MAAKTVDKLPAQPLAGLLNQAKKIAQRDTGQAMVEFALTLTVTLMLIFGLIEFSRAIYAATAVQWAAQEGARAAIIDLDNAQIAAQTAAFDRMVGLDTSLADIDVTVTADNLVEVGVTYQFEFVVPLIATITGDTLELSGSASMVAQAQ